MLKLTADERGWLEGIVRTGKSAAWKIRHANAFLKVDRGEQGPAWEDCGYVRQGMCVVWMFVEPLAG